MIALAKPFNPLEVIARVKSLLRRSTITQKVQQMKESTIGPLTIKKNRIKSLHFDGKEIQLTVLEFGILFLLASHQTEYLALMKFWDRMATRKYCFYKSSNGT